MRKYCPILKSDRTLKKLLPRRPNFIYRREPTLRNKFVHDALDPPRTISLFPNIKGFYRCQKCLPCRKSKKQPRKKESFRSTTTGREYKIKELITCTSTHVTYVIECPCRYQYLGRTTRPLFVRIGEHMNNIRKGFIKHRLCQRSS